MISDSLIKISKNLDLTPNEADELRLWANQTEKIISQMGGLLLNTGMLNPDRIQGLGTVHLVRQDPFEVQDNTTTSIPFDNPHKQYGVVSWDFAEPTKMYRQAAGTLFFFGAIQWEANGTGYRSAHIELYDSAGVLSYGETLHNITPSGIERDTLPFALPLSISDGFHLELSVLQTSGGALDVNYATLGIIEI